MSYTNSFKFYLYNFYTNFKYDTIVTFFRKTKQYTKNKNYKIRLYCKNIVLFTILLSISLLAELHLIYYKISVNFLLLKNVILFIIFIISIFFYFKISQLNFHTYV